MHSLVRPVVPEDDARCDPTISTQSFQGRSQQAVNAPVSLWAGPAPLFSRDERWENPRLLANGVVSRGSSDPRTSTIGGLVAPLLGLFQQKPRRFPQRQAVEDQDRLAALVPVQNVNDGLAGAGNVLLEVRPQDPRPSPTGRCRVRSEPRSRPTTSASTDPLNGDEELVPEVVGDVPPMPQQAAGGHCTRGEQFGRA